MNNELVISLYNTNDEKHIKIFIKHTIQSFSYKFINDFIKLYSLIEMKFKNKVDENVKVNIKAYPVNEVHENKNISANERIFNLEEPCSEVFFDKPLMSKGMQNIDDSTFHFDDVFHECYSSIVNISGQDLYNLYCNYINMHTDLTKDLVLMLLQIEFSLMLFVNTPVRKVIVYIM